MMDLNNIYFLVGNKNFKKESYEPFNPNICNFLDELSIHLFNSKVSKNYTDIKTLAFFCRKKKYLKFKKKKFKSK